MAAFPKMTLTNAGQALQTKVLAGATLTFTRIALGDGQLNSQPISPLTTLISQKASVEVSQVRVVNTTTAQAAGFFSNADISTGFWWRETGLFAQDPDVGEILYGYTNAGDAGDYIPTVADTRIEKYIFCSIAVANADTVDITIPASDTFIPISDKGVPGGVATLDATGKLEKAQIPDIDCGIWDETPADPVLVHNVTPTTHTVMLVDGNNYEPVDNSTTLEEHIQNPNAHQNLVVDGNNT